MVEEDFSGQQKCSPQNIAVVLVENDDNNDRISKNKNSSNIMIKPDSMIKCSTSAYQVPDRNNSGSSNLSITSNISNISTSNKMTGVVERRLSANYRTGAVDLLPPSRASSQSITKKISNSNVVTSSGHHHVKNPSSRVIINRQQSNILKSVKQQTDTSRGSVNSQQQQSSTASLASSASSSTTSTSTAAPMTSSGNHNRHRSAPLQQTMTTTRNHIEISPQSKNRHQTKIIPLTTTRKSVHKNNVFDKSIKSTTTTISKGVHCDDTDDKNELKE